MKLTEQDRLLLTEKKEEILAVTDDILKNVHTNPDEIFLKTKIQAVLSLLSTIASYVDSKSHHINEFYKLTNMLIVKIQSRNSKFMWYSVGVSLDLWCSVVNSMQFKFTEKKAIINLPQIDLKSLADLVKNIKPESE